ncbi:MAG TPA: hypothetical protein VM118_05120 [Acidobacteriota bacterium]|nr:hypothetical protein [Acidobacteriota bacterium]
MTFRAKALIGLLVIVAVAGASPVFASLDGNRYTNDAHRIELSRPDATWELRERLPIPSVVAGFVVGDGTAAAALMHYVIPANEVLTDATDLARRRNAIAATIACAVTGQPGPFEFERTEFSGTDDRITFDLFFSNRETGRGALENWVQGFIVRDDDDRQHIYAVRCAVTRGTFQSWASQFERIVPTLHYTGAVATPTYTSRPIPIWWWFAGGVVLLVGYGLLRSRRSGADEVRIVRPVARSTAASSPQEDLAPVDFAGSAPDPGEDVPDILRATSGGPSGGYGEEDLTSDRPARRSSTVTPEVAETAAPEVAIGYWTCRCGRKNSEADTFCVRCNTDRS